MITKETCVKIWNCWQQIDNSETLLKNMAEKLIKDKEKTPPTLHNAFGENVGLQLGIPSGNETYRLYNINLELSTKVIETHIEEQKRKLKELEAICKIELHADNIPD